LLTYQCTFKVIHFLKPAKPAPDPLAAAKRKTTSDKPENESQLKKLNDASQNLSLEERYFNVFNVFNVLNASLSLKCK
jgi:hypothetical protein